MSRMRLAVIALLRAFLSQRAESDGILAIFATLVEGSEDSACTVLAGAGYRDPGDVSDRATVEERCWERRPAPCGYR